MSAAIQTRLIDVLHQLKEGAVPRDQMAGTTKIIDELGIDSLEMINLFLAIEDEFEIEIQYDRVDIETLESIDTLTAFIETQIEND